MMLTRRRPPRLVDLNEIAKIELLVLKRLSSGATGDHRSRADGTGFDFVGLRDWQAGDRFSAIDWAQSSLTNFAPLVVREFDQPSTATVLAVADASLSTRCGADGMPLAAVVARALATIGLSAAFFQDRFGLLTFDRGFAAVAGRRAAHRARPRRALPRGLRNAARSRSGGTPARRRRRARRQPADDVARAGRLGLPVRRRARRRARAGATSTSAHDVFLVLVDSRVRVCDRRRCRPAGSRCTTWKAARRGSCRGAPTRALADRGRGVAGRGGAGRPATPTSTSWCSAPTSARASWRWPSSWPSGGCGR